MQDTNMILHNPCYERTSGLHMQQAVCIFHQVFLSLELHQALKACFLHWTALDPVSGRDSMLAAQPEKTMSKFSMKLLEGRGTVRSQKQSEPQLCLPDSPTFPPALCLCLIRPLRFFCIHYVSTSGNSQKKKKWHLQLPPLLRGKNVESPSQIQMLKS